MTINMDIIMFECYYGRNVSNYVVRWSVGYGKIKNDISADLRVILHKSKEGRQKDGIKISER